LKIDKTIDQPNQVRASHITYIPMRRGFLCLFVLATEPSTGFVVASVERPDGGVLRRGTRRSPREMNVSESLLKRRKPDDDIQTGV
jgi:hypothetical protein